MKQILVDCVRCSAIGKIPMSEPLAKTLRIIRAHHPINASEIYRHLKHGRMVRTGVNQSVKKLTRLGFVKSSKAANELRVYFPA